MSTSIYELLFTKFYSEFAYFGHIWALQKYSYFGVFLTRAITYLEPTSIDFYSRRLSKYTMSGSSGLAGDNTAFLSARIRLKFLLKLPMVRYRFLCISWLSDNLIGRTCLPNRKRRTIWTESSESFTRSSYRRCFSCRLPKSKYTTAVDYQCWWKCNFKVEISSRKCICILL